MAVSITAASTENGHTVSSKKELSEMSIAIERLHVMLHQEYTIYSNLTNYLTKEDTSCVTPGISFTERSMDIDRVLRQKTCEWIFDVVDFFGYSREAAMLAAYYLDRFASLSFTKGMPLSRRSFQLASIASLLIATKIDGGSPTTDKGYKKLTISTLVGLGRGQHSFEEIQQMEIKILRVLWWKVNPPTMAQFISHLMLLFPSQKNIGTSSQRTDLIVFEMAKYLSELAVCVSELAIEHKPSEIAFASLIIAIDSANTSSIPQDFLTAFKVDAANILNIHADSKEIHEISAIFKMICPKIAEQNTYLPQATQRDVRPHHHCIQITDNASGNRQISPTCISGE